MLDFILGALSAFFGGLVPMQLLFGKAYALDEYVDKEQDPKRYWTLTLAFATASIGALLILL